MIVAFERESVKDGPLLPPPPYYCHYKATELIRAHIKGHAARCNTELTLSTTKEW